MLATGAVSLALAGVFLVQYGVESGLLTPSVRVYLALAFGALLIAGGEALRRRFGDETDTTARFLPSALSGAGFLTLFAAILAAYALYALIGQTATLAGLVLVSALAILFGWFYGPLLSAVGVVGSILAPYMVGGETDAPWVFAYYFALIATVAFAIDSVKRWAWLSVLGGGGAAVSIWLTYLGAGAANHVLTASTLLAIAALTLPERRLVPSHGGPPLLTLLLGHRDQTFPTLLGAVFAANATAAALSVGIWGSLVETYLALFVLALLFVGATVWLARAPALIDLAMLPILAFLALVAMQGLEQGALFDHFKRLVEPETPPPGLVWQLVLMAALASGLCVARLRGTTGAAQALYWSLLGASVTPATIFLLEHFWAPSAQYGAEGWALVIMGAAVAMTLLSERSLKGPAVREPKLHASLFGASALGLIGLALFLVLTTGALTLALAGLVLLVGLLDRRFDLPLLGHLTHLGTMIVVYRTVVDPGVMWATDRGTPPLDLFLTYLGTAAILLLARSSGRPDRARARASIEGCLAILAAAFLYVLADRFLPGRGLNSHWGHGLMAALWLIVAADRLRGLPQTTAGGFEWWLRIGVAGAVSISAAGAISLLFGPSNPLLRSDEAVGGVPFLSTLALAYVPLAAVLALSAWRLEMLGRWGRIALGSGAAFLVDWYAALSIRHVWRGPDLTVPGVTDLELYAYTVAMILLSAASLLVAFVRRSHWLRTVSMAAVALTVAKVFLVDMAGLTGLMRAVSFMGLGLSLLGLTWLNRVMAATWDRPAPAPTP